MKIKTAAKFYGTRAALAGALKLKPNAISMWEARYDGVVPELYARKLRDITGGQLRFIPSVYGETA